MSLLRNSIFRIPIVAIGALAWLSISNHCAIGGLVAAKTESAPAQMHCHGDQPSPAKKGSDEEMPCCKMLRATVTNEAKIVHVESKDFLSLPQWVVGELVFVRPLPCHPQELDTGPPFAGSFAESVLQRSILAHAPPVSLG